MVTPAHPGDDLHAAAQQARRTVGQHQLQLTVIVPVFNNGEYLRTRAFPSLLSAQHFGRMHVLLVDDGSTYQHTVDAVAELAEAHPNVSAFFHATGGSGSGSRPRNTGFDLSATAYTGFLDPDDEFIDAGPWPLVTALEAAPQAQLAIGDQQRVYAERSETVPNTSHYTHQVLTGGSAPHARVYRAGGEVLAQARFRPTNLSSYVVRTEWLQSRGIRQVPGAAGQDTLFFREVFSAAEAFVAVPRLIYCYHAETPGSMVNTVTIGYLRKCLLREQAQVRWLRGADLLESYVQSGLERSFAWYLPRLRQMPEGDRRQARELLTQIAELYVDPQEHHWRYPEVMAFFRRPGVPSWEGVKPLVASAKRSAGRGARSGARRAARTAGEIRSHVRTRRGLDP